MMIFIELEFSSLQMKYWKKNSKNNLNKVLYQNKRLKAENTEFEIDEGLTSTHIIKLEYTVFC